MKDEENSKQELAALLTEARRQIRELKEITEHHEIFEQETTASEDREQETPEHESFTQEIFEDDIGS